MGFYTQFAFWGFRDTVAPTHQPVPINRHDCHVSRAASPSFSGIVTHFFRKVSFVFSRKTWSDGVVYLDKELTRSTQARASDQPTKTNQLNIKKKKKTNERRSNKSNQPTNNQLTYKLNKPTDKLNQSSNKPTCPTKPRPNHPQPTNQPTNQTKPTNQLPNQSNEPVVSSPLSPRLAASSSRRRLCSSCVSLVPSSYIASPSSP